MKFGVIRFPGDLSVAPSTPDVTYTGNDTMYLTWAFFRKYGERVALPGGISLPFRVRGGASDLAAVQAAATADLRRTTGPRSPRERRP